MKNIILIMTGLIIPLLITSCGGGGDNQDNKVSTPPTVSYQSVTIPADEGEQVVVLNSLSSPVSSVGSTPTWLNISPQFYTSGAPSVKLVFKKNSTTEKRNCQVAIKTASGAQTVLTVTQKAGNNDDANTGMDGVHNTETDKPAYSSHR